MTPQEEAAYMETVRRAADAMRKAQTEPRYTGPTVNIATYWRPSQRHQWRLSSTQVNVPDPHVGDPKLQIPVRLEVKSDGSEYAYIPYDWECWTPPPRAKMLPGLAPVLWSIGRER